MLGKISRLPHFIREQLNERLLDSQPSATILEWLNSLPETRAVLAADFNGQPIDEGNLSEYRKRGFRKWKIQRAAREFSSEFDQPPASGHPASPPPPIEHFVQWISLRLAAAAQDSTFDEDPRAQLRDIRTFLADIVALRRGELISRRIGVEEQRLALIRSKNQQELESHFWEWTRRPDIQARLYPHRDPDALRRNVVRMLDRELLGVTHPNGDEPEPDPACAI